MFENPGNSYGFDAKQVLRLTQDLIRIRSSHPEGNELDIVKFILSLFDEYDVMSNVVHHGGNRASLSITIRGKDSERKTALVGHIDTIAPFCPDEWMHPPYAADYDKGIVYGIGASNGKGGVAAMINAAADMLKNGVVPRNDTVMCFTSDGDGDGLGATALYEGGFLQNVSELIFADPTNSEIGIAQKGVLWLDVTATSARRHVLEVDKSVEPIERVLSLSRKLHGALKEMPSHPVLGKSLSFITNINTGNNDVCILPGRVSATLDVRYSPLIREDAILSRVEAIARQEMADHPGLSIDIRTILARAPIGISGDAPIVREIASCYKKQQRRPVKMGLGFYSDSSRLVPRLGVPFVLLGPGDWIFSDRGDEFVSLESILFTSRIYTDYLTRE